LPQPRPRRRLADNVPELLQHLESARECPRQTAEIGDTVPVTLTIHNRGWLPVPWVLLEDLLPDKLVGGKYPRLRVKGKRLLLRMIRGGGTLTVRYELQVQLRGYYQIGSLVMECGDLFGLHRRYHVGAAPHFLLVYPKVVPLEGYDIVSRRPIGEVRLTHRLYEDPTRIAGVRRYETGDPLNRVHWRATARTGALHCKVYEPSTPAGATVLLDFHRAGYASRGVPHRSELAVTTAASLANAVYVLGQQVGLVTNGRDAADRIRVEGWEQDYRTRLAARQTAMCDESARLEPVVVETRRGVEQLERIRETLARVELTDGLTLAQLVGEAAHRLPRDATVLAVLPDAPQETALALGNLRRRGHAIAAVLVMLDDDRLEQAIGRLLAEGVRDVRHLRNEEEIPALCRQEAGGAATYQVVTDY
jgi:uncharacterized repeat protein (TIGR01451 family)